MSESVPPRVPERVWIVRKRRCLPIVLEGEAETAGYRESGWNVTEYAPVSSCSLGVDRSEPNMPVSSGVDEEKLAQLVRRREVWEPIERALVEQARVEGPPEDNHDPYVTVAPQPEPVAEAVLRAALPFLSASRSRVDENPRAMRYEGDNQVPVSREPSPSNHKGGDAHALASRSGQANSGAHEAPPRRVSDRGESSVPSDEPSEEAAIEALLPYVTPDGYGEGTDRMRRETARRALDALRASEATKEKR